MVTFPDQVDVTCPPVSLVCSRNPTITLFDASTGDIPSTCKDRNISGAF